MVTVRRDAGAREHPPQIDDHLRVHILAARTVEDLNLGAE
jgi:hypothetical protein